MFYIIYCLAKYCRASLCATPNQKNIKKHHILSASQIPEKRNLRAPIRATLRACPRMPMRNISENPLIPM